MSAFVCLLFLLLFLAIQKILKYRKYRQVINEFNGPPTKPLIGNLHQVGRTQNESLMETFKCWNLYGKSNFRIWFGPTPIIYLTEPKDVEFILTNKYTQKKAIFYKVLHPVFGMGLVTSSGLYWQKNRKMITPSFHFNVLKDYHTIMITTTNEFIWKLKQVSAGGKVFDFQEMALKLTLDVICEAAMGVKVNAIDGNCDDFIETSCYLNQNFRLRLLNPLWSNKYLFKLMPEYKIYKKHLNIFREFTKKVIKKRLEVLEKPVKSTDKRNNLCFLDTILNGNIDGRPLTETEIEDQVTTFISAGNDTTGVALGFIVYLLSRHPEEQKKVYEEQIEIIGDCAEDNATFPQIADMKYLDMVIKESLRLFPIAPVIGRTLEADCTIGDKRLYAGSFVNIFFMGMNYNEINFPEPNRFKPERFDPANTDTKLNAFGAMAFSAGPRNCIGQKFALLEMKTVISKLVRTFEIQPPIDDLIYANGNVEHNLNLTSTDELKSNSAYSKYEPILSIGLTQLSLNGIQIRLKERQK